MSAAATTVPGAQAAGEPQEVTLLQLVKAVCEVTEDDREVVATVIHMLGSGSVRLKGNFRGASVEEFC
jgi:hypothetical protein